MGSVPLKYARRRADDPGVASAPSTKTPRSPAAGQAVVTGEVSGIPVVWQHRPGPLVAAVGFRVGRADEPLARGGVTHLVEHLALSGIGDVLWDYNGWVNGSTTWFGFRGRPDELGAFLARLQQGLTDLPVDRLDAEIGVLGAEDARRPGSIAGRCLGYWFGSVGWGTLEYPEYGLNRMDEERAQAWCANRFGRDNAVLWMTGQPPGDAALELPAVAFHAEPEAQPQPFRVGPTTWLTHQQRVTAISYLAPRTDDTLRAATILQSRLRALLRGREGLSYDIGLSVDPLDVATAHVLLTADGTSPDIVGIIEEAIGELVDDGPTEEELIHQQAAYLRAAEDDASLPSRLGGLAHERLCGWPTRDVPTRFDLDDDTAPQVIESIEAAVAGALVLVPPGVAVPSSFAVPAPEPRARTLEGRTFKLLHPDYGGPQHRLVIGAAGVTDINGAQRVTVAVEDVTAALLWPDGSRALIASDGTMVSFDPALWSGPRSALRSLDTALPTEVSVPMAAILRAPRPKGSFVASTARTSLLVFGGLVLWLFTIIMWAGVFSGAPDANNNPIGPLIYTGLSVVVTLSLRDRVRILWTSRRPPAG
ncbi:MAG TPA: hypothetical protein VMZ73_08450 [Acidimicrobiales bacterium]|nr:hypothetical protein [Acidimicrobiales bacterium]